MPDEWSARSRLGGGTAGGNCTHPQAVGPGSEARGTNDGAGGRMTARGIHARCQ